MTQLTIFWILAAVVLGIIEASTVNLITLWFAVSALVTAVFAALGAGVGAQITIFVVLSAVLVLLTRPLAKKFVSKKTVATNADRVILKEGIVTQKIDTIENSGQVKVMGQVWSAKTRNGETLEEETPVVVEALEGVRVVVSAKK
ncbi:MAG: NfeD family protein [Clostridia bacterium]|nr:NfeD family protein [Clostridia bacterium]